MKRYDGERPRLIRAESRRVVRGGRMSDDSHPRAVFLKGKDGTPRYRDKAGVVYLRQAEWYRGNYPSLSCRGGFLFFDPVS